MKPASISLAVGFYLVALVPHLEAQVTSIGGSQGTVTGGGQIVLERLPDTMRIQVALLSKASNLKEALEGLEERAEAAKAQLAALGVRGVDQGR